MNERQADKILDLRGWSCPWYMLKAKSWLGRMSPGQILEVLSTDPDVMKNFPRVLEQTADRVVSLDQNEGFYRVRIRRGYGENVMSEIASLNEATWINLKLKKTMKDDE
jgi:tRNA 2-thiouridine synthesizing protein A